jgi:hypothetical protein
MAASLSLSSSKRRGETFVERIRCMIRRDGKQMIRF